MRFVDFENWHLGLVLKMYEDDPSLAIFNGEVPDVESHLLYTLMDGGEIVAIGGILSHPWKGLGEMFFYKSPVYSKHMLSYTRMISKLLDILQEKGKFHRLQASIPKSDICAIRFIEFLRFKMEAVLSEYGPDREDYFHYVRFARIS